MIEGGEGEVTQGERTEEEGMGEGEGWTEMGVTRGG